MRKMPEEDGELVGPTFVRGPALAPADQLLAWLEDRRRDAKPRLVRVPVVLATAAGALDLASARLGAGADALAVRLDDSLLGVGLEWHAKRDCKGQSSCAFWVHGYVRGTADGAPQLDLVKMEAHIPPEDLPAAGYAEVESDSARGDLGDAL
jgi:hypothetical protein